MNIVSRQESKVTIRQIPFFLWFACLFLSLPLIAFSLVHIFGGTEADGKYFTLFFGLFLLWIFLEFVVRRERIIVDLDHKVLTRKVNGVFRHKEQVIDLREMKAIRLEIKKKVRGNPQHLYIYGIEKEFELNSPSKLYLNQSKLGKLVSEVTGIPFKGELFTAIG
jgi:hypothetical protein